jgi:uncharacterized phage protein (TIGR01671 family)
MEDRFKFRAWNALGKEMSEPFHLIEVPKFLDSVTAVHYEPSDYQVPHAILMQCTGLKDKNGKLIFEGDILDKTDWCNGIQEYKNGAVEFGLLGDSDGYRATDYLCWKAGNSSLTDVHSDSMIVGTIYENPDLLKE